MNRIILSLALATSITIVEAQSTEDALRYSMDRPSGTARNISLGGAMGALGGDFSSILTNPAGIAVYRSSEFTFTPSLHFTQTDADFYGMASSDDRINVPFQQIGFVGTYKPMREATTGLISTHFGIGYNRKNSYFRNTFIQATGLMSSLLDDFVDLANQDNNNKYYTGLAFGADLINTNPYYNDIQSAFPNESVPRYMSNYEWNYLRDENVLDEDGNLIYSQARPQWGPLSGVNQLHSMRETGNTGEFNLSFGANFDHKFYIGGALGISTYSYSKELQHYEEVNGGKFNYTDFPDEFDGYYESRYDQSMIDGGGWFGLNNFTFSETINTNGIGVDLKVGAIYKPTNSLRIGVAIHTPSFYSFDEEYNTSIYADQFEIDFIPNDQADYDDLSLTDVNIYEKTEYGEFSYNFRTPLKGIGSLAYTFGSFGLISMDYEYTDYSTMQYKSKNSSMDEMKQVNDQNDLIKETFKATHNLKFGAEFKPTEVLTLRAGYGINQSPYKEGHFKNDDKHQTYSAGIGYRMNNMFIDFGYMLRQEKYGYSLYYTAPYMPGGVLETAQITTNQHQLALTLGWRF